MSLRVGQHVDVEKFPQSWYVATIVDIEDGGDVRVHYHGWSERLDETVGASKVSAMGEDEFQARVATQLQTKSPFKSPSAYTTTLFPTTGLHDCPPLTQIVGCAHAVFTEPVDNHSTALVFVNQYGDPTMNVENEDDNEETTAARHSESLLRGKDLLDSARNHGIHVVHITLGCWKTDGTDLEYFKQRAIGDDHAMLNERPIHPDFDPAPGEAVLLASTSSAFASTGLDNILRNMNVVYPIFAGSFTDGCLGLTAAESISRGYLPTVISDAACGSTYAAHTTMLRLFDQLWGRVRTTQQVIAEFGQQSMEEEAMGSVSPYRSPTFPRKPGLEHAHQSPRAKRAELRHHSNAATLIQASMRRHLVLKSMDGLAEQRLAALRIQSVCRGKQTRAHMEEELERSIAELAATAIQSAFRGIQSRGDMDERLSQQIIEAESKRGAGNAADSAREPIMLGPQQEFEVELAPQLGVPSSPKAGREPAYGVKLDPFHFFGEAGLEEGIRVHAVDPAGPAAEAGILPGDILVALAGHPITVRVSWYYSIYVCLSIWTPKCSTTRGPACPCSAGGVTVGLRGQDGEESLAEALMILSALEAHGVSKVEWKLKRSGTGAPAGSVGLARLVGNQQVAVDKSNKAQADKAQAAEEVHPRLDDLSHTISM
jgi:nicotinamidase-related amidase